MSKNVCHGVAYDKKLHFKAFVNFDSLNRGTQRIVLGMNTYLRNKPQKLFHDPLTCVAMLNNNVVEFKQVEPFEAKGEWGSNLKDDTNTFISISYNYDNFIKGLLI